jgi:hypothetical protein
MVTLVITNIEMTTQYTKEKTAHAPWHIHTLLEITSNIKLFFFSKDLIVVVKMVCLMVNGV